MTLSWSTQVDENCRQLQSRVAQLEQAMEHVLHWIATTSSAASASAASAPVRPCTLPLVCKTAPGAGGVQQQPPAPAQPVEDFARGLIHQLIQSSVAAGNDPTPQSSSSTAS